MKKTIKAWAVFLRDGSIDWHTVWPRKTEAICMGTCKGSMPWADLYSLGYRVRRITITVDD